MKSTQRLLYFMLLVFAVWFLIVAVNVNNILGLIYLGFTIVSVQYIKQDKKVNIPLDKNGKWLFPFAQAILIYGLFVITSSILLPYFEKVNVGSLLQIIATTNPAFGSSIVLNTLSFVGSIPFVETIFFVMLFDYSASFFNIDISKRGFRSGKTWFLMLIISFLFLLFHATAKGITNNLALSLVFFMMMVTLFFAIFFQESKQVIFFHMISNGVALNVFNISGAIAPLFALFLIKSRKLKNG